MKKRILPIAFLSLAAAAVMVGSPAGPSRDTPSPSPAATTNAAVEAVSGTAAERPSIDRGGVYYSRDEVALYVHTYGTLPTNFITKAQARALGWTGGPLEPYAPGKAIGGDHYGNYEGVLPRGSYRECDIDTLRRPRGAKRLVFSRDRRIYYSDDHYRTFERLY